MSTIYVECLYLYCTIPAYRRQAMRRMSFVSWWVSFLNLRYMSHMTACVWWRCQAMYSYFIARYYIFGMIVYVLRYYFIRVISFVHVDSANGGRRCMYIHIVFILTNMLRFVSRNLFTNARCSRLDSGIKSFVWHGSSRYKRVV